MLKATLDGFGIAYLPEDLVQSSIEKGKLVRLRADWTPPIAGYHLYYPSRRQPTAAFTVLLEALRYRDQIRLLATYCNRHLGRGASRRGQSRGFNIPMTSGDSHLLRSRKNMLLRSQRGELEFSHEELSLPRPVTLHNPRYFPPSVLAQKTSRSLIDRGGRGGVPEDGSAAPHTSLFSQRL